MTHRAFEETATAQALKPEPSTRSELDSAIARARAALEGLCQPDGHWVFELEADCTIPSEYILMMHFMDEVDVQRQRAMAAYIRNRQQEDGGWPLYPGGSVDVSCSVKAYYALKLAGDTPDAAHMERAREAILANGGAARSNVFTRIMLAQFRQVPWRAIPFMPVEIMLLPRWFPFHLSKISYWSRAVMVPLLVLYTLRVRSANPSGTGIRELFVTPPEQEKNYFPVRSKLNRVLLALERLARPAHAIVPGILRRRALRAAERWIVERLNGQNGLGAIFPAMVNAYEALSALGYSADHPHLRQARAAIDGLLVEAESESYCQPCVSPVWDTCLACLALHFSDESRALVIDGLDWLARRQLRDEPGDWRDYRPNLPGGGWPFEYGNGHYPDLDDTAAVAWAMQAADPERYRDTLMHAADWLVGMQSRDGGFASFDADNTHYYLNEIPFADHGALLDPPTADVTARCATFLALIVDQHPNYRAALDAAVGWLRGAQEADGSWFGRWGTNYIYGTWTALTALAEAGVAADDPAIVAGRNWLKSRQRNDGGWGEHNDSYNDPQMAGYNTHSSAYQTAWAMLGLIAASEPPGPVLSGGAEFLLGAQTRDGLWEDRDFTAPGFPKVFYLRYHGYPKYFPLWALGRYRALLRTWTN